MRILRAGATALVVLAACKGNETDTTDTETHDTDTTDTDSHDTDTTDTDTTTPATPQQVTLNLEGSVTPGTNWRVGAFSWTATDNIDGFAVGAETVSAPVAASVNLTVDVPAATAGPTIFSDDGVRYLFLMYDDANTSGSYDAGETIEGGAEAGALEFVGTTGKGHCSDKSWCAVHFETALLNDTLPSTDVFTFDLHDLHMQSTMEVKGTVDVDYLSLTSPTYLITMSFFSGVTDHPEIFQLLTTSSFDITIGEPDEVRTLDQRNFGFEYALERLTAYYDGNDNTDYEPGEGSDLDFCPIENLLWADTIDQTNLNVAASMALHGWHQGWQAVGDFDRFRVTPDNGLIDHPMRFWYYCG